MAGLIDKNAELVRLSKEVDKIEKDTERLRSKLGNADFVARAPADVVAKEQERLAAQLHALEQLRQQQQTIAAL